MYSFKRNRKNRFKRNRWLFQIKVKKLLLKGELVISVYPLKPIASHLHSIRCQVNKKKIKTMTTFNIVVVFINLFIFFNFWWLTIKIKKININNRIKYLEVTPFNQKLSQNNNLSRFQEIDTHVLSTNWCFIYFD